MSDTPFIQALGRVPSGVFILTVRHEEQETGMLASWVQQAAFQPPAVTVAVRHGRYVTDWLSAGAPLVLNLVAEGGHALLKHFGHGFEPGVDAFDGLSVSRTQRGVPVLADAAGYLECRPTSHIDSGDHRIFLAEVIDGRMEEDRSPIVHVRKSGAHY